MDLGILDVLQIFGRAGRPQYNDNGYGVIITSHNKLHHYLSLMTNQFPIESRFISHLADNLNAEVGYFLSPVLVVVWTRIKIDKIMPNRLRWERLRILKKPSNG